MLAEHKIRGVYGMTVAWHIGRKAIIAFLTPFLDLPPNPIMAWKKVRRWNYRYSLPIEHQPNSKPYIDEATFFFWWEAYQRRIK